MPGFIPVKVQQKAVVDFGTKASRDAQRLALEYQRARIWYEDKPRLYDMPRKSQGMTGGGYYPSQYVVGAVAQHAYDWGKGYYGKTRRHRRSQLSIRRGRRGYARTSGYYGRFGGGPGGELKFIDNDADGLCPVAGTITIGSVVNIAQNTTETGRIGRKINLRQLHYRINLTLPATSDAAQAEDTVRIIVYHDKQCNGTVPSVTAILETAQYQSFNNLSNKSRFRILMDRTYTMNSSGASTANFGGHNINDEWHKNCNLPIEYSGVTGSTTEIRSNNVGILCISKNGHINKTSCMRARFADA